MCLYQFVRIDNFPEHLHQVDTLVIGKPVFDRAGKTKKLNRIFNLAFRRLDKRMGFIMPELEAVLAKPFDTATFGLAKFRVRCRGIDKQYRRREMKFVRCVATIGIAAGGLFDLEKGLKSIKHRASYHTNAGSANHMNILFAAVQRQANWAMVAE